MLGGGGKEGEIRFEEGRGEGITVNEISHEVGDNSIDGIRFQYKRDETEDLHLVEF